MRTTVLLPQGHVDDIKIGDQADITPKDPTFTGLTFWDHFDGTLAFCHNSSGSAGSDTNGARISSQWTGNVLGCLKIGTQTMQIPSSEIFSGDLDPPLWSNFKGVGQGGILGMARSDGIEDGFNVIQGVRTYDPSAGTWTTPDAYAGDVHVPMSQKSYIWNHNNPVGYGDPTGYAPSPYEPINYFLLGDSYAAAATAAPDDGQSLGFAYAGTQPHDFQYGWENGVAEALLAWGRASGKDPTGSQADAFLTFAMSYVQSNLARWGFPDIKLVVGSDEEKPALLGYLNGTEVGKAYVDLAAHGGRMYGGVEVSARIFGTRRQTWSEWLRLDYSKPSDDVFFRYRLEDMPLPYPWHMGIGDELING